MRATIFRLSVVALVSLLAFPATPSDSVPTVALAQEKPQNNVENYKLDGFESYSAFQATPVWCWAACIEMIANSLKKERITSQPEIVTRAFGVPVITAAPSLEFMVGSMKQVWIPNAKGYDFRLDGKISSSKDPVFQKPSAFGDLLRAELKEKRAVILAVNNSHVVVCYGVDLQKENNVTRVIKLYVMDPWPATGQVEVTPTLQRDMNGNWLWTVTKPGGARSNPYFISDVISGTLSATKTISHPKPVSERMSWLTWGYEQADVTGSVHAFAYFSPVESYKPRALKARVSWKVTRPVLNQFGQPIFDPFGQPITETVWLPPAENFFRASVHRPQDQNVFVASLLTTRPTMANGAQYLYYHGLQLYWVIED